MSDSTPGVPQIKASELAVGMKIDRSHSLSPRCVVLELTTQTLNDGRAVVRVSYGNGEGATFYADEDVNVIRDDA